MRFVICEILNSLEKTVKPAEKSKSWSIVAHNGAIKFFYLTTQLLWLLHTKTKSEHSHTMESYSG